jgi:hypothetical protein
MSKADTFISNFDHIIDTGGDILIRLSRIMLMLGFMAGTVAVLSSQFQLASIPGFNLAWSIGQAIAIDGLFFGVWTEYHRTKWIEGQRFLKSWYFLIGSLLGIVAALVNNILSYQELNRITSVSVAMARLGISEAAFSYTRSTLVVLVSILIVTLPRVHTEKPDTLEISPVTFPDTQVQEIETQPSLAVAKGYREQVKELLLQEPGITALQVSERLSIGESTAKRHCADIRKELLVRDTDTLVPVG